MCKFFQRLKCDHGPVDSILNSYLNIGQECNAGRKKGSTFHAWSTDFVNSSTNHSIGQACSNGCLAGWSLPKVGTQNIPKKNFLYSRGLNPCLLECSCITSSLLLSRLKHLCVAHQYKCTRTNSTSWASSLLIYLQECREICTTNTLKVTWPWILMWCTKTPLNQEQAVSHIDTFYLSKRSEWKKFPRTLTRSESTKEHFEQINVERLQSGNFLATWSV